MRNTVYDPDLIEATDALYADGVLDDWEVKNTLGDAAARLAGELGVEYPDVMFYAGVTKYIDRPDQYTVRQAVNDANLWDRQATIRGQIGKLGVIDVLTRRLDYERQAKVMFHFLVEEGPQKYKSMDMLRGDN